MTEEIRKAIEEKIKELERRNQIRSLEMIDWLKELLKKSEVKEEKKPEPIRIEIKDEVEELSDAVEEMIENWEYEEIKEEKKATPKRKIVFKKK